MTDTDTIRALLDQLDATIEDGDKQAETNTLEAIRQELRTV